MVVCTDESTFDLRFSEYSNALLLTTIDVVESGGSSDKAYNVHGLSPGIYELRPAAANTHRLKELLDSEEYSGAEEADEAIFPQHTVHGISRPAGVLGWTLEELENIVQCSSAELVDTLQKFGAIRFPGDRYRLLSEEYCSKVLDAILLEIQAMNLDPNAIRLSSLMSGLQEIYSEAIIRGILLYFGKESVSQSEYLSPSQEEYSLCFKKVALHYACRILRAINTAAQEDRKLGAISKPSGDQYIKSPLAPFILQWQDTMERIWKDGLLTNLEEGKTCLEFMHPHSLRALIVLEKDKITDDVLYTFLPEKDLPAQPDQRFNILFTVKSTWNREDLVPYILPLANANRKLDDLLLAHCRLNYSADGKNTVFSFRH